MNIAIYGGAFNPPTLGHKHVIDAVLGHTDIDWVYVIPSYKHMYNKNMVPFENRLVMCKEAFGDIPNVTVLTSERTISNMSCYSGDGSTIELLDYIQECNRMDGSSDNYHIVIGADNADTIDKWRDSDKLQQKANFIVIPRGDAPLPSNTPWYASNGHIYLNDIKPFSCSSSMIRHIIYTIFNASLPVGCIRTALRNSNIECDGHKSHMLIGRLLDVKVWDYIVDKGYYITVNEDRY